MEVIERKSIPIYEVECYECHSKIQYRASEVSLRQITCPVCGISLWANTICPVRMESEKTNAEAIEDLESVPSADVVERKKGKWLHKKITDDFHVVGQCSVCKEIRRIDNFCPNCGADMREES